MRDQNKKFKIVIAEAMAEDGINILKYKPDFEVVLLDKTETTKLLIELVNADALIVRGAVQVTREAIKEAERLKVVARAGLRYGNIDVGACTDKGIVVMNTPTANSQALVELTIGLMIALARSISAADTSLKSGNWDRTSFKGTELAGKTVGIIGLGNVGSRVAEVCNAFGMKILAKTNKIKRNLPSHVHVEFCDSMEDLLPRIDFLTLHVPLNDSTHHLIKKADMEKMKSTAFLINTSPGAVVDEKALYEILREKRIAGAAIDMYSKEPATIAEFPFITSPKVISLPHLGADTLESYSRVSKTICEHIIDALENKIFIDTVNLPFSITEDQRDFYYPYLVLARKMGQFAGQWMSAPIKGIHFQYRLPQIQDLKPLIMTACCELLNNQFVDVSIVNVQKFLDSNSIELLVQSSKLPKYENCFELEIIMNGMPNFNIRGMVISGIPKFVEIQGMAVDMIPVGHGFAMLTLNVPGVIGSVASLLGERDVNIANLNLSQSVMGKSVISYIQTDQEVSFKLIDELKQLNNMQEVKKISFD